VDRAVAEAGWGRCGALGVTHHERCFFGGSVVAAAGPFPVGVARGRPIVWRSTAGRYSSGSEFVLDARSPSVMTQIRIFDAIQYDYRTRVPPATASRFASMSPGEKFDQSAVTCRSSNVAG